MKHKVRTKKYILLILLVISLTSCNLTNRDCINGEGNITTEVLSLSDFEGIHLAGPENVMISQGSIQEVKVVGHPNIIKALKTTISNNIWDLRLDDGCYSNYELAVEITVPTIRSLELSGSGSILVNDFDNQSALNIEINGSGRITLNEFEGITNFEATLNGSGYFKANNDIVTLRNLNLNNRGSGSIFCFELHSDNCTVNSIGSGNVQVTATNLLDVMITGSGDVFYKGTPRIVQNINGTGHLINAN